MVAMNFNAGTVDPSVGGQDVFETGEYGFIINASETRQTNKGGTMLVLTCKCTDEGQAGKQTAIRLNIQNASAQAVEIAFRDLSAICHVVGVLNMTDTQQLHGRPFRMRLEKTPRTDKPELFNNEIRAYLDPNGEPPVKGAVAGGGAPAGAPTPPQPPAAAPAAPQPPAAAPAAPSAPPAPAPAEVPAAPAASVAPAPVAPPTEAPVPAPAPAPAAAPPQPPTAAPAGATPPWQQ